MKEGVDKFLENLFSSIANLLPKLILAAVIILIGFLLATIVQKLVKRLILYLNEGLNERLQKNLLNVDLINSAAFISKTFYWVIIIIALLISIQVLELNFMSRWFDQLIVYLPNVLAAVIIIFVGIVSGRLLGDLIKSAASRTGIANGKYLGSSVRYLIVFISIVIAVDQLGIDIAFLTNLFIIIIGSILFGAALAFGLGAKISVSNILGAYYVKKSYQVGEKVQLGEVEGVIVKISDHDISLETSSGVLVVPAKDFSESRVLTIKNELK